MTEQICGHLAAITAVKAPRQRVCEACVKTGDRWVHLRTCQECGATLCCDSSPMPRATQRVLSAAARTDNAALTTGPSTIRPSKLIVASPLDRAAS